MLTRWGHLVDPAAPHPEHPRPQLFRPRWRSLNGHWDVAFTQGRDLPRYDAQIVVPFSPEAELSGVARQLQPHEALWYRRLLPSVAVPAGHRLLLHFGAVDQRCRVLLDGREVGGHIGGYLPFTLDLTDHLPGPDGTVHVEGHELVVVCHDGSETTWHTRGKQRLDRGGIWYTAQSGIWQSVWLEVVPALWVERLELTPHLAEQRLDVQVVARRTASYPEPATARLVVLAADRVVAEHDVPVGEVTSVRVPDPRPWRLEDPFLHDVRVRLGDDEVTGHVGMRDLGTHEGRFTLNGEPVIHVGVLDQGYWPDGLYTAPSDDAIADELATVKRLGFTMVRKHVKVEPLRWYHHADRVGLLVWQDVPNGGGPYLNRVVRGRLPLDDRWHLLFGRQDAEGRSAFRQEVRDTVHHLRGVTGLAVWVPFNEGWGQFDANDIAEEVARIDPTRAVNHACGWQDQGGGDVLSRHEYLRRFRLPHRTDGDHRVLALSEYGGMALRVDGHVWGTQSFGYRAVSDAHELERRFRELHEHLTTLVPQGLAATVYTQLTDVEDELNGLLTYDREVCKIPEETVRSLVQSLVGGPDTDR